MFQSILVPVDIAHSPPRRRALPVAVDLAEKYGGRIHLMTVIPDYGMSVVGSFFPADQADKAVQSASDELNALAAEYVPDGMLAGAEVRRGNVYREILAAADACGCDAIVMTAHRPEMKDYLIGPNAARVVRHATQMVVVVR